MKTRFIIIRHGQSEANLSNYFAGNIDTPLTDLGRKQGKCTAEFLENEKIDVVYSSDLSRAYETALFTAEKHGLPVIKHKGLREIYAGLWEGNEYSVIREKYAEQYNLWITNIGLTHCNGGESVEEVGNRVYTAIKEIAEANLGKNVCVGCHALALRAFVAKILNIALKDIHTKLPWVNNASVTYIDYEDGKFTLIEYGMDKHLEESNLKVIIRAKV